MKCHLKWMIFNDEFAVAPVIGNKEDKKFEGFYVFVGPCDLK